MGLALCLSVAGCGLQSSPKFKGPSSEGQGSFTAPSDFTHHDLPGVLTEVIITPAPPDAGQKCGNGVLDDGETCDPGLEACCNDTCNGVRKKDVVCRAVEGACDEAETCDGKNAACPDDALTAKNTECRAAAGDCDVAESCDGAHKQCPLDAFKAADALCREASGDCDVAERCTGASSACPADGVAPKTAQCASAGSDPCDADDYCDGIEKSCPDLVQPKDVVCGGPPLGACDAQDTCDGSTKLCQEQFAGATTPCGSSANTGCDKPDTCDGQGGCMPNYVAINAACGDTGVACHIDDKCDGLGQCADSGVLTPGTPCGSSAGSACDNPDTCDASGSCQPNHAPANTGCGDTNRDCYVNDACDGNGACTNNGFQARGTACGSSADTECDNPDSCDGSGTCLVNQEPSTTNCGDQGIDCRVDDKCDGNGACHDNGFKGAATPCGDGSSTQCDSPDTCNASGTCLPNHLPATTNCGDQGVDCRFDDKCDGNGACHDNGFKNTGTACGSQGASQCDSPDSCDNAGVCQPRRVQNGDPCGDQNVACHFNDSCQNGACVDAGFRSMGTACGSTADTQCDNPDTCSATGTCLANYELTTANCGDQGVDCHVDDKCDGLGACKDNGVKPPATACGSSASTECDSPDNCDASGVCRTNHKAVNTACGDTNRDCYVNDKCDGNGACTDNGFRTSGTACGSAADTDCDNPDACNGGGTCLTNHELTTVSCGQLGVPCLKDDKCDGLGACADQGVQPTGTACGSASDTDCDNPDNCNASGNCLANLEPTGTQCPDTNPADCKDAQCNGAGVCSQTQGLEFQFTACGSTNSSACDNPDTCDSAGACQPRNVSAGTQCPDATTTDCNDAQCNGSGTCNQTQAFEAMGAACGSPTSDECTKPDTCNAGGTCLPNHVAAGSQCTDTNLADCKAAQCNGTGACDQTFANQPDMMACGDSTSSECDNPDRCNNQGACLARHVNAGAPCTDTTGSDCKAAQCDGSGTCDQNYANQPDAAACGDGVYCNGTDKCASGACSVHAGNPCPGHNVGQSCNDSCTEANGGSCTGPDSSSTACSDGVYCNGTDTCNGSGACGLHAGNPCLGHNLGPKCNDSCTEANGGSCTANDADGTSCNNNAKCSSGICCPGVTLYSAADTGCEIAGSGVVFVTSTDTDGAIGGLTRADSVCQSLATSANLAGTYSAWLSTTAQAAPRNAIDRVSGGPYRRVDGALIAPDKPHLTNRSLGSPMPIDLTEWGDSRDTKVWTGTLPSGTVGRSTCGDWTDNSATASGDLGASAAANDTWTYDPNAPGVCSDKLALYCFQDDCPGIPYVDFAHDPNNCGGCGNTCKPLQGCTKGSCGDYVFVTSTSNTIPFQPIIIGPGIGAQAGDAICNQLATRAGLTGVYAAWLSTGGPAPENAIDRVTSDGPFVLVNGTQVAVDKVDLTDGTLAKAINLDENGGSPQVPEVWTGTAGDGTPTGGDCSGWLNNSSDSTATVGNDSAPDTTWTKMADAPCNGAAALYCFQIGR